MIQPIIPNNITDHMAKHGFLGKRLGLIWTDVNKYHEDSGKSECENAIKSHSNRTKSLTTTVDAGKLQKKLASFLCC